MWDAVSNLFDTTGFVPRRDCGAWTDSLIWLHVGSDIFIWLAYISIPMVLAFFVYRRTNLPFRGLFWLFAAFILACGFVHFLEAVIFTTPLYRLSGFLKLVTAIVSWCTVFALVRKMPQILELVNPITNPLSAQTFELRNRDRSNRYLDYLVAVLAAILAVLVRYSLDIYLQNDQVFVVSLLAVVAVSWYSGFGPAMVTLMISMAAMVYFFVSKDYSLVVKGFGNQLAVGLFFFCGVGAAVLGEAQRQAQRKSQRALAELQETNALLAQSQRQTTEALVQLDTFLLNAPVGIAFFDEDLRYLRVNKTFADANGHTMEDHIGRTLQDILPHFPEDLAQEYREIFRTGKPILNRMVQSEDVPDIYWQVIAFPVPGLDGKPVGLGVIGQDVTEQKRAEKRLQESEARFRGFVDNSPAGFSIKDMEGRYLLVNNTLADTLGQPVVEILGKKDDDLFPAALCRRFQAQDAVVRASGTSLTSEDEFERHDRFYSFLTAKFALPDGAIGSIITDITQQKMAERDLKESESRFRTLAEALPQIVWITRPDGYHEYYNARWYDYTGMSREESIGWGWSLPLHPEDKSRSENRWKLSTDTGRDYEIEYRFRSAEGNYRWFLGRAVPIRDHTGQIVRWFGTCTDIDDQKRQADMLEQAVRDRTSKLSQANEALEATAAELRRSNEELEKFAYIASHDLQEPLRKIQAFGDRLAKKFHDSLGEQGKDYIDRMLNSAGRMRTLINDLLTFSRVTTKAQPFVLVSLSDLVREVIGDLDEAIVQTAATIEVEKLPSIHADAFQMQQLFQNLLANALKFRKPNQTPHIVIQAIPWTDLPENADPPTPFGSGWRITVTDNGIGFEQQYADRIFELFQRLHGRNEYEGTGLGLAICRKIMLRHGGTILARSQPNLGSTFILDFPNRTEE